jgi:anti-anti-sigma factor
MSAYELDRQDAGDPNIVQVRVAGELDLTNAGGVEAQLDDLATPDVLLVLDLNRVVFIDSAALHMLFKVARRRGQGKLGLVLEPTAPISRALAIVGLGQAVRIAGSLEELTSSAAHA